MDSQSEKLSACADTSQSQLRRTVLRCHNLFVSAQTDNFFWLRIHLPKTPLCFLPCLLRVARRIARRAHTAASAARCDSNGDGGGRRGATLLVERDVADGFDAAPTGAAAIKHLPDAIAIAAQFAASIARPADALEGERIAIGIASANRPHTPLQRPKPRWRSRHRRPARGCADEP